MQTNELKTYLRVLYKQGLLSGDLNRVQQYCLNWALIDERQDEITLEEERMKYTVLAGNQDLYRHMFVKPEDMMALQEDEWQSVEQMSDAEIEELYAEMEAWQTQRES